MAHLVITLKDSDPRIVEITPEIEYAFEAEFNTGIYKKFRESEKQSDLFWLAWRALQTIEGIIVKPFGIEFIKTLKKVEYDASDEFSKKV